MLKKRDNLFVVIFVTDPTKEHLMALNSIYDVGLGATFKRLNALKFPNAESRIRKSVSLIVISIYAIVYWDSRTVLINLNGIPVKRHPYDHILPFAHIIWAILLPILI